MRDVYNDDTYTPEELRYLVNCLLDDPSLLDYAGFLQFRIRGIYVSGDVIKQALNERLELMAGGQA